MASGSNDYRVIIAHKDTEVDGRQPSCGVEPGGDTRPEGDHRTALGSGDQWDRALLNGAGHADGGLNHLFPPVARQPAETLRPVEDGAAHRSHGGRGVLALPEDTLERALKGIRKCTVMGGSATSTPGRDSATTVSGHGRWCDAAKAGMGRERAGGEGTRLRGSGVSRRKNCDGHGVQRDTRYRAP